MAALAHQLSESRRPSKGQSKGSKGKGKGKNGRPPRRGKDEAANVIWIPDEWLDSADERTELEELIAEISEKFRAADNGELEQL